MCVLGVLRGGAAGACVVTAVFLAAAGTALAAPTPPLTELMQAQSHVSALAGTGDIRAKAALGAASAYLAVATAESLWVDPSDAVPPPDGDAVFTNANAAVKELKRIHNDRTVAEEALLDASNEVLEAQADLADIALEQVQGSDFTGERGEEMERRVRGARQADQRRRDERAPVDSRTGGKQLSLEPTERKR